MIFKCLYAAAGVDTQLISQCSHSEKIKHVCMGALILILSTLSFSVVLYILLDVMLPLGEKSYDVVALIIMISSFFGLMVYNIFRLMISSAGYGDGTFRVAPREVVNVFAPWVMSCLFGICFGAVLAVLLVQGDFEAKSLKGPLMIVSTMDSNEHGLSELMVSPNNDVIQSSLFHRVANILETAPVIMITSMFFGIFLYALPILLKLVFWRKGPYEYLVEFQDIYSLAQFGVIPKAHMLTHKDRSYFKERFLDAELLLEQSKLALAVHSQENLRKDDGV